MDGPSNSLARYLDSLSLNPKKTGRQLALHMIKWLPEFALKWSERASFDSATGVAQGAEEWWRWTTK
jgi:hypothetical protein